MQGEGRDCRNQGFTTAIIFHQRKPVTVQAIEVCSPTEHQVISGKGFGFLPGLYSNVGKPLPKKKKKKIENLGNK